MKSELEIIAEQLPGWDKTGKQPESCNGQQELFATQRGLPRKAKREHAKGQDFLFDLKEKP